MKYKLLIILMLSSIGIFFCLFEYVPESEFEEASDYPISQEVLTTKILEADQVIIKNKTDEYDVFYESKEREDLITLNECLQLPEDSYSVYVMSIGEVEINLYKNGEKIASVICLSSGGLIRSNLWSSDTGVKNPEKLFKWLEARGVYDENGELIVEGEGKESDKDAGIRWESAVPKGLEHFSLKSSGTKRYNSYDEKIEGALVCLDESIPNKNLQILALLNWYGSGTSRWSPVFIQEGYPEEILSLYSLSEIVSGIESQELTSRQLEGAARFLGSPYYWKRDNAEDVNDLPDAIKKMLWDYIVATGTRSKINRVKTALGSWDDE